MNNLTDVIAIFDIGKTNKKVILINQEMKVVFQHEEVFEEITDDDGFPCDDINKIVNWMMQTINGFVSENKFGIKAINFATYGASVTYLDKAGKILTPLYNYLKTMPDDVVRDFYQQYGSVEEFNLKTACPSMGMLNWGLQILWLKKYKPSIFQKVQTILPFPQYLSYCFTGKPASEYTYPGCHSAIWDFEKWQYHQWLSNEGAALPAPEPTDTVYPAKLRDAEIKVGIGIHDSSASLVPYFSSTNDPFILISTGTWCIFMNPFNDEPLTTEQLNNSTLCYISTQEKQVKSSLLFLGHVHKVNAVNIANHFGVGEDFYKKVKVDENLLKKILKGERLFFRNGIPDGYVDNSVDLNRFESSEIAYQQLVVDLTRVAFDSLKQVIPQNDTTRTVFVSGGFARNEIFLRLLQSWLPAKKIFTSEMENATALGAALIIWEKAFGKKAPKAELGLKEVKPFDWLKN